MSTIRLSGTSSGYYDLTVPAVAGTNSIDLSNLPVKDSSNNLNITGKLGVGTTTPHGTYLLKVGPVNTTETIAVQSAGGGSETIMQSVSGSDSRIGSSANTPLNLITNNVSRMTIDTSGHVTTPTQPYFYAGGNTNGTAATGTIPFNTTEYNVGNHYNTSNYTFTAPIAGNYLFTCSILNYPNTVASGEIYFSVNGGGYSPLSRWNGIPGQASLNLSAIKKLSANDTVKVIGTLQYYITGGHGHFSGMLLG